MNEVTKTLLTSYSSPPTTQTASLPTLFHPMLDIDREEAAVEDVDEESYCMMDDGLVFADGEDGQDDEGTDHTNMHAV